MAMVTKTVPDAIKSVLCCPICESVNLTEQEYGFLCPVCGWKSLVVEGDTLSFAPIVYNGPRTRTRRVSDSANFLGNKSKWFRILHRRFVPWRGWIFRNLEQQRRAIDIFREKEMRIAQFLLTKMVTNRRPILLELGVGWQNHLELYRQLAEYAICSDIYRDPVAVEIYKDVPWVFYCLINVEQLPIRESSLDIIISSHVVEHFPDRVRNLKALYRVLKPGGIACHIVPTATGITIGHLLTTFANIATLVPRLGSGVHGEYDSIWDELKKTTVRAWRGLFESCGFEVVADEPGILGFAQFHPLVSRFLADTLGLQGLGSRIFILKVMK